MRARSGGRSRRPKGLRTGPTSRSCCCRCATMAAPMPASSGRSSPTRFRAGSGSGRSRDFALPRSGRSCRARPAGLDNSALRRGARRRRDVSRRRRIRAQARAEPWKGGRGPSGSIRGAEAVRHRCPPSRPISAEDAPRFSFFLRLRQHDAGKRVETLPRSTACASFPTAHRRRSAVRTPQALQGAHRGAGTLHADEPAGISLPDHRHVARRSRPDRPGARGDPRTGDLLHRPDRTRRGRDLARLRERLRARPQCAADKAREARRPAHLAWQSARARHARGQAASARHPRATRARC